MLCDIFFFKQKTAYDMRISDWSSDVCSSDLLSPSRQEILALNRTIVRSAETMVFYPMAAPWVAGFVRKHAKFRVEIETTNFAVGNGFLSLSRTEIGRASCRERVGQYV